MSEPSLRLTVARMPFFSSTEANFATAFLSEEENPVSSTGFTGMRFTCIGKDSLAFFGRSFEFNSFARSRAAAGESFFPEISVY